MPDDLQTTISPERRAAAVTSCCMSVKLQPRLELAIHQALLGDAYMALETMRSISAEIEAAALKRIEEHAHVNR